MNHDNKTIRSADGTELHTQWWLPTDGLRAVVALVHGWSDHSGRYMNLVDRLVPVGIGVQGIDLRGHGRSTGQRGHINAWSEYRADVDALLNDVEAHFGDVPLFLFGHSMGGLVVMDYAIHHPNRQLNGLISSSPLLEQPNVSPAFVRVAKLLSRVAPNLSLNPGADPNTVSRDPAVVEKYSADPLGHNRSTPRFGMEMLATQAFVMANLDGIQYPFLLYYGTADALVPVQVSQTVLPGIGAADKTRFEYDGGYHELINDIIKAQVLDDVAVWLEAHI
ncbi:MAG: lysophospholipase [Chloroflexota bacterium]